MTAPGSLPPHGVKLRRAPDALWRAAEFGVVVLSPEDSEPRTLTGTGPALWDALETAMSADDLAKGLAARFGVVPGRVAADISPVLAELHRIGALEAEPG